MTFFDASGPDQLDQLFELHLDVGLHHGAQFVVYHEGERVVDLAGGTTGPDGEPTTPDRKHVLFSCTKPYAAVCLHHLVDRGLVAYDDPVRSHWPDFAEPGTRKAEVTVRHVLSHQAGLPQTALDADPDGWTDWEGSVSAMEAATLSFDPGETAAYHSLSFGFLVGELVQRISGTPVNEYAREHVFAPLGMDATHIGLPDDAVDDVATLVGFSPGERAHASGAGLAVDSKETAALFNREEIHRAVIPAASGTGTARDLARFFACLAEGGSLDGTQLLSAETVDAATALQVQVERDGTMGVPRRYALGFERAGTVWDKYGTLSPGRVFGHSGLGSIVAWGDPTDRLAMAYTTNGIREEYEHVSRANAMADAVRTVFS